METVCGEKKQKPNPFFDIVIRRKNFVITSILLVHNLLFIEYPARFLNLVGINTND